MSANDLINFWEKTISKFDEFCDIYVTGKQSEIAEPWI